MTDRLASGRASQAPRTATDPRRILVVPFADGIGDFVMMLPLLDAVRQRYPEASVSVAASQRSALLLDEAQAATFQVRTPSWLEGPPRPRGGPLRRLVPQSTLASVAGVTLRLELGRYDRTLNFFSWWERGLDFGRYWTPQVPPRTGASHTLDVLAERLGGELGTRIQHEARRPRVQLREAAAEWAATWWQEAGLDERHVVALIPASNMRIKRWPVERWAALYKALRGHDVVPLLLLPPDDDPVERQLSQLDPAPLTLRASLDRMAAVIVHCEVAVGVDTGLLHLAAAVGTRYVGLFGPTNPEVTGPYDRTLGTTLVAPFTKTGACRGCWRQFKYIDDRCKAVPDGSCMSALAVQPVLDACLHELGQPKRTLPRLLHGDQMAVMDRPR